MQDREDELKDRPARSSPGGVSRRDFLKGSGAAVAATAVVTAAQEADAQQGAAVVPAKPTTVKLNVNGKEHSVTIEPRVTLLDVLRNDLNFTGAKEVCTTANCGACTVLIDGKPTYACTKLAVGVQGLKITTSEGLGKPGEPDGVAKAFVKHDATQCGFCTPGFVVAVRAFCDANPGAKLDQVLKGLGGNICRCGTYHGVVQAAMECCGGKK